MYTISKQQIEQLMLITSNSPANASLHRMLQGLLAQPEQEPVAIGCKCSECSEWQRWTPSGMTCKNGHGGARGINQRLFTHPAPFTPITADDVTDEMVNTYHKDIAFSHYAKYVIAAAVNTWGAKK
jgi:hypothetical protein